MPRDLSESHRPVGSVFADRVSGLSPVKLQLNREQLRFYADNGYVVGPQVLADAQIESLREELGLFFSPDHVGHELWYEYHANEAANSDEVLFHSLGAWRIGTVRDGVCSDSNEPLLNGVPVIPAGKPLGGQFFPLLYGGSLDAHRSPS